jgi:hypothetical protein
MIANELVSFGTYGINVFQGVQNGISMQLHKIMAYL